MPENHSLFLVFSVGGRGVRSRGMMADAFYVFPCEDDARRQFQNERRLREQRMVKGSCLFGHLPAPAPHFSSLEVKSFRDYTAGGKAGDAAKAHLHAWSWVALEHDAPATTPRKGRKGKRAAGNG